MEVGQQSWEVFGHPPIYAGFRKPLFSDLVSGIKMDL